MVDHGSAYSVGGEQSERAVWSVGVEDDAPITKRKRGLPSRPPLTAIDSVATTPGSIRALAHTVTASAGAPIPLSSKPVRGKPSRIDGHRRRPLSTLTPLSYSTRMCPYPQHLMRHPPQYDELSRGRDCRCNGKSLGAVNAGSEEVEHDRKDNGDNCYTQ